MSIFVLQNLVHPAPQLVKQQSIGTLMLPIAC